MTKQIVEYTELQLCSLYFYKRAIDQKLIDYVSDTLLLLLLIDGITAKNHFIYVKATLLIVINLSESRQHTRRNQPILPVFQLNVGNFHSSVLESG